MTVVRTAGPGLLLAAAVAVPAVGVGTAVPVVGGPVAGLLAGGAVGWLLRRRHAATFARCQPGLAVAARTVLQAAVVVLGLALPLGRVAEVGLASLPVLLGTLVAALAAAWLFGRLLRLHGESATLIGVGTAICGASAIAAVSAVLRPAQERVAYALGTMVTFNLVAVATFPALGHLLGLSDEGFGLWAGTAINDTSSVVAAAYAFGAAAGAYAVVVKLGRSLLIVPICLALAWWQRRRATADGTARPGLAGAFPPFIGAFLAASALAATGVVPADWQPGITTVSTALITMALAAIGATLRVRALRAAGPRPLVFGGLLGLVVAVTSLGLQALTGGL